MQPETQNYLVKAVVSLLQEARPYGSGIQKQLKVKYSFHGIFSLLLATEMRPTINSNRQKSRSRRGTSENNAGFNHQ